MINIGNTELNIKLGNEDIPAIYIGDTLIYPTTVTAWTVEPSSLSIPFDGEIARIKLAAVTAWTATTDVNWITLSESTGDGGRYNIDVTVSPNISTARTANVVITGEDSHTETISISQAALPFSASVDSISTYNEGGTFAFDIMCPHSWTIVVSGDSTNWLTVSPLTGGNGTVQVGVVISQLEGDEGRDADLVITDDVTGDELIVSVQQTPTPPYETLPLTFEIISGGTILWKRESMSFFGSAPEKTIEYSINEGVWTEIKSTTAGAAINVTTGDIISFRGNNTVYSNQDASYLFGNMFQGTAVFKAYGNINSLIDADNFSAVSFWEKMVFAHLFNQSVGLIDAEYLVIQADNSNAGACREMFYNCTNLTTAPKVLLAPSISSGSCYQGMFKGCTSLTTAPELPSTTLADACYQEMFLGCTSLTSAPVLPATTIKKYCYMNMFNGCTSLTTAPVLPATTMEEKCYSGMFGGCTGLTAAPELPATIMDGTCYQGMFYDCTSLTTAPELPATILAIGCYKNMFQNCTSLSRVTCLATITTFPDCTTNWLNNVSSTGTFVKNPNMSSWTTGANGIPTNWTVQDAS